MTDTKTQFDLTQSQMLIWTGQKLQPEDPLYNMVLTFRIDGSLDPACFRLAFEKLVRHCDTLRCTFETVGGVPKQRFLDAPKTSLQYHDFSGDGNPEARLADWVDEHKVVTFDIENYQYESALLKLGERRYVWYLNQHHLITDAWAVSVIFDHMQRYYALAREGRLSEANLLPSYEDYLGLEFRQRSSAMQENARAYWAERLEISLQPSRFYRPVPVRRHARTIRNELRFGAERSKLIRSLAQAKEFQSFSRDLSLFQIFCTVLLAYMYRVTGNSRLAIGTPAHNRVSPKLKQTVGLLIEIFPVMVSVDEGETFASLYRKVSDTTREMLMNAPPGSSTARHNRAYDVFLNYITASFGAFDENPTRSEWVHADHGDRNHLLRLQVHDFDLSHEIGLYFDLNADAFSIDEREWVGQHYLCLLDALLANTGRRLADVALVPHGTPSPSITSDEGTEPSDGRRPTVIELVERQARATPDAVALVGPEQSMTFGQLDALAGNFARSINARVGADGARIAVAMRRSADYVAAILGILKSGCTYVPVDPSYPAERIQFILDDSRSSLLVTDAWAAEKLPPVKIDTLSPSELSPDKPPPPPRGRDAPAYIIYTSGSTGHPKGVVVGQQGFLDYVQWASRFYDRGRRLYFALFSSLSFDLTVTSLFTPLVSGGRLIVYPELDDPRDIVIRRVVEDNAADVIKLTPAHLSLLQTMDLSCSRLKTLIVGGEDLKSDIARTVAAGFKGAVELYNEYGPTEGTVACMIHRFDPDRDREVSVPIGQAVDHAQIYLLDEGRNPVPRGVRGQIYIGGSGVAEGYFGQSSLTAERFVDDPDRPGRRLYATGDLGRLNGRNEMEFLGRADRQIKIRGYRVEPGEIETVLAEFETISDCVVVARERTPATATSPEDYCVRCGLSANHPGAMLDERNVCRICHDYETKQDEAQAYFRTIDDLRALVTEIKASANGEQHDSLMLLSGGKDSTYALCRLVDMGLNPLVFTLDNGFISDGAKANIRRIVDQLGLELVVGKTPSMNEIFVDSLKRFSNVCDGCFKTIYTLSMNLAEQRGIRYICTGLSRGQIFETRVANLFHQGVFNSDDIDRTIVDARKAYHRLDDVVSKRLDVKIFSDDALFERVRYVDFYRYCDVTLDEMLDYLATRAPWVRPADTGRSTNCLINEAGIYVHRKQRGHHNYSLPYSWDVRLGHKERDAAREELNDQSDPENVRRILDEIGYPLDIDTFDEASGTLLAAYYVAAEEIPADRLRTHLARRLPSEFIPARFTRLDALPMSPNGKIDRDALPEPAGDRAELKSDYVEAHGASEQTLARIWVEILGVDRVGATDNFFDLGGESILNIQIVALARKAGIDITPQQIFDHPTIRELAGVVGRTAAVSAEQGVITGSVSLTPIQQRFFDQRWVDPDNFSQSVLLEIDAGCGPELLESALARLLAQHDALRSTFEHADGQWRQQLGGADRHAIRVERLTDERFAGSGRAVAAAEVAARLSETLCLAEGKLVRAALIDPASDAQPLLLLVLHHLVVDGVSWWILLDDLEKVLDDLVAGRVVTLPRKTTSVRRWSALLGDYALSSPALDSAAYWENNKRPVAAVPVDEDAGPGGNGRNSARTLRVSLDRGETRGLLQDVPGIYRTQVPDVLLAAIASTLSKWSGDRHVQIDIEGHGREAVVPGVDLLRTVGWFTSIYPIILDTGQCASGEGALLKSIKEQLRAVPNRGIDYGVARYLAGTSKPTHRPGAWPDSQVVFNYLGQWGRRVGDSGRVSFAEPIAVQASPESNRDYLIEINAVVFDGRLTIEWTYSENTHRRRTIESLAFGSLQALRNLIDHCLAADGAEFTPSDFPTADLSQSELDKVLAEFGE